MKKKSYLRGEMKKLYIETYGCQMNVADRFSHEDGRL